MNTSSICPACGATLRAVDGLCPTCLARAVTSYVKPPTAAGEPEPAVPGYEILEMIGRGGMGVVYRAVRMADELEVALKLMPLHLTGRDDLLERLQREADSLRSLQHPNVLRIVDSGITPEGRWFMATELAEGGDLGQRLQKGPLPVDESLTIFRQTCAAIAEAHRKGIAHRDIKPANILLTHDGSVRVADFSLAKLLHEQGTPALALTQTMEVFGTPYYIAPEVRRGSSRVDARADIFSLGVLLHEMLTGRLPIGEYMPASALAKMPPAVDRLIARCLQEDPARRPATADVLLRELEQSLRPARWRMRSLIAASAAMLTLGVWFGLSEKAPPASARPADATLAKPWTNSLGMSFVPVPGTRVLFCQWETRIRDFEAHARDAGLPVTGRETRWRHPLMPVTPDHPITPLSKPMAERFCDWLTSKERSLGIIGNEEEYRLPTDEEWSRAYPALKESGGTPEERHLSTGPTNHALYVWGRGLPGLEVGKLVNFAGQEAAPLLGQIPALRHRDEYPFTSPVTAFPPNSLGLYNLSGNVSEWCSSRWQANNDEFISRGGAWCDHDLSLLRADHRRHVRPIAMIDGSGFRIVLVTKN